jgi:hypothetical protein
MEGERATSSGLEYQYRVPEEPARGSTYEIEESKASTQHLLFRPIFPPFLNLAQFIV